MLTHLKALQAFEAVGRLGSVSEAARRLEVSPGAVSQQIHKLEAHIGVTLIERSGRRMELTSWGRIYHREIAKGFALLGNAAAVLARARNESGLTVSALTSVVNKWIGREIFDWQARHPEAAIQLVGTEREPELGEEDVDFRICYGARPGYRHYVELFTDWVVPACAPQLVAGRPPLTPAELLGFPLLHVVWVPAYRPAPGWTDWARSLGLDHREEKGLTYTLSSSAIDAAVAGRGFVLGQMSMMAEELATGRLVVPVDHRLPLSDPYCLAWNRASLQKPYGEEFRRWIIARGRRQGQLSAPVAQRP